MKIEIVYASYHHNNTERVVLELEKFFKDDNHEVFLNNVTKNISQLSGDFDFTIFASGIYYWGFHKNIFKYLDIINEQVGRPAFVFYTAGTISEKFPTKLENTLKTKGFNVMGSYGILGFDTFGPLRFTGGINKNMPTDEDIRELFNIIARELVKIV